jgi:hypothetical protein
MAKLKEKISLRYQGGRYIVTALENRLSPSVGYALTADAVEKLLLEAKVSGCLTVKIL